MRILLFVYYLVSTPETRERIVRESTASGVPKINVAYLRGFDIQIPPLRNQRAIAAVLGALDDKIELNRRMNRKLEELGSAIFKSWFVDFDPVQAKRDSHKPFGVPPKTAGFFTDHFKDSDLGPIPSGWKVATLGEIASFIKGKSYKTDELKPSSTALVTLKSFLRGGGYRCDGVKEYVGEYKPEQVVLPGELVVACTDVTQAADVVGRAARVLPDRRYERLVASLDTVIVRPISSQYAGTWLAQLLATDDYVAHVIGHANGTTVLHLASEALPNYRFACPPSKLADAFNVVADPLYQRRVINEAENTTLTRLRDALLPAVLSGDVSIGTSTRQPRR